MIEEFVATLTEAATDDSLRAIHIRGAGDDFCSGADWVATNSSSDQRPRAGDLLRRTPHAAHRVIEVNPRGAIVVVPDPRCAVRWNRRVELRFPIADLGDDRVDDGVRVFERQQQ